jgi:hypothetical protein
VRSIYPKTHNVEQPIMPEKKQTKAKHKILSRNHAQSSKQNLKETKRRKKGTNKRMTAVIENTLIKEDNVVCVGCKRFFVPGVEVFECSSCGEGPCHYTCLLETERFGLLDKHCLIKKQRSGTQFLEYCMSTPGFSDKRGLDQLGPYYRRNFY